SGDTSLAVCAQRVSEMLPACDAVARLATLGAPRLGEFAAACRDVCDDCEKECRKHADTHTICKACADSCARFIAEAKHLTLAYRLAVAASWARWRGGGDSVSSAVQPSTRRPSAASHAT